MSGILKRIAEKLSAKKQQWPPADRSDVKPRNCPICNGKIIQKDNSDSYVCLGLKDRREIDEHHLHPDRVPSQVTSFPPCGWHALAEDFGKTWE